MNRDFLRFFMSLQRSKPETAQRHRIQMAVRVRPPRGNIAQDGVAPPPLPPLVEPADSEVTILSSVTIDKFTRADFAVVQFNYPDPNSRLLTHEYTKAAFELKGVHPGIK